MRHHKIWYYPRVVWAFIHRFFLKLYFFFKIQRWIDTGKFLFHRYSTRQFSPLHARGNFQTLIQKEPEQMLDSTSEGKLFTLETLPQRIWFRVKNVLLFGAFQSRVKKVVYYTFLTLTIEIYNPFDRDILERFLYRKIDLLKRLLKKTESINGKNWDKESVYYHLNLFLRGSLLQKKIIEWIHLAVKRQKEPEVIKDAKAALKKGLHPLLITVGCSGAYWMRNTKREIAGLFKPFDEEIHAPNNPIGPIMQGALGQRKTRYGIRVGEAAHREVAAYLVDQFFGFGIVPRTYYATFTHHAFYSARESLYARRGVKTKYGSFQEFIEGFEAAYKLKKEERKIPLEEFQLLVLLDVIVGNTDRHMGNILIGEDKIAAIDHGLILPDVHDRYSYWYWEYFEEGKERLFPVFQDLLNHFPYEKLTHVLRGKCLIQKPALQRLKERIALFSEGVNAGHPPVDLIGLMTHETFTPLLDYDETLRQKAKEIVSTYVPFIPEK